MGYNLLLHQKKVPKNSLHPARDRFNKKGDIYYRLLDIYNGEELDYEFKIYCIIIYKANAHYWPLEVKRTESMAQRLCYGVYAMESMQWSLCYRDYA